MTMTRSMRSILARAAFVAVAALSATAVPAAAKDGAKAPADLQKRVTELEAAFNAHDAKKIGALFTPEGSFINPMGQRATGRGEVVSRLAEDLEGPLKDSTMQIRIETARMLSPTLALLDVENEVTGPNMPPSTPRPARAHGVAIWQKTGGKWMVVALRPYFFLPPQHGMGGAQHGMGGAQHGMGGAQHGMGDAQHGMGDAQHGAAGEPTRGEPAPVAPAPGTQPPAEPQGGGTAPTQR